MIYSAPDTSFVAILDAAPTGLVGTLTVQIENPDGTTELAATTAGIVEVESGIYAATLDAPDTLGTYIVVWNNAGTRVGEELRVTGSIPAAPGAGLLTLAEYKARAGVSGTSKDVQIDALIPAASQAIRTYTGREFGADEVTEDREFLYNGRGVLDIDDARAINTVSIAGQSLAEPSYLVMPHDGPPYTWLELPRRGVSPEMGFTYNLDTFIRERGQHAYEVVVNADWGVSAVPADVKMAAVWTVASMMQNPAAEGALTSESVAEVARAYASKAAQGEPTAVPPRARELLDPYRVLNI